MLPVGEAPEREVGMNEQIKERDKMILCQQVISAGKKLLEAIGHDIPITCVDGRGKENINKPVDEVIGLMEARTEVNNAPTLDVKPVIHAHWIEHKSGNRNAHYTCSHCGKEVSYSYAQKRWKYCIECGAKMDEEDKL